MAGDDRAGVDASFETDEYVVDADVAARPAEREWQQKGAHCWTRTPSGMKSHMTEPKRTHPMHTIFVSVHAWGS